MKSHTENAMALHLLKEIEELRAKESFARSMCAFMQYISNLLTLHDCAVVADLPQLIQEEIATRTIELKKQDRWGLLV